VLDEPADRPTRSRVQGSGPERHRYRVRSG
jgi:hypothetical protein